MRDYYEDLWRRLPERLDPPDFELRRGFLLAGARPGERALDLGCGDGAFTVEIARAGLSVVGVDVAEAALERARSRDPALEFALIEENAPLPFGDNAFELIWASEVIEHIADTGRWLSEVRRVLTPGGRLLLTTPSHGRLRLLKAGIEPFSEPLGDHLHLYTRRSLGGLMDEFGFRDVRVRTAAGPPGLRRLLMARALR